MLKRCFDFLCALLALLFCVPFFFSIAILVKLDSRGPIFFHGARVGKDGVFFCIWKFRTMVSDAAERGAGITTRNDPRITRVGKFLRRWKLDELPQLWNVVRGEMSLVGPRPEDPRYLQYYTPAQRRVLSVAPGITSAASLAFGNEQELLHGANWEEVYIRQVLPAKLNIELDYLEHRTFWTDVAILCRTGLFFFRTGVAS